MSLEAGTRLRHYEILYYGARWNNRVRVMKPFLILLAFASLAPAQDFDLVIENGCEKGFHTSRDQRSRQGRSHRLIPGC